jgi:F-type H+-transporting ATPase subunit delta
MNHQRTLARPYARAIFELAARQDQLVFWSNVLQLLAVVTSNVEFQQCYLNPRQSRAVLVENLYDIVKDAKFANKEVKNFLLLLNLYRRLLLLPVIAELFEEARTQHEQRLSLMVTSAFSIPEKLRQSLQQVLEKKLQRAVNINYTVDTELLGGLIVRVGDLVMDGSVKSQLQKLKQAVISE